MATLDEELDQFENDIRRLKVEYDQYFGGGKKRPPTEIEWRIETLMKRRGDRGADMNFSQRFRYTNLSQTYAKYKDIFRKRMKQMEEGTSERHFGAAAREIEKQRAEKQAAAAKSEGQFKYPFAISCNDPDHQEKKVDQLFEAFRHAKQQAGENTERFTIEVFRRFVRQKTDQMKKQQNAREVEYIVTLEGNTASLKARVKI
jgi:hypothetical protein